VYEEPRELLETLFGDSFIEMNPNRENAWCCGAGGGVKIAYPDWSVEIADKRIKNAFDTKADYLVSTCPFCKRNLKDAIIQYKTDVQVIDLIELLNQAEIINIPEKK